METGSQTAGSPEKEAEPQSVRIPCDCRFCQALSKAVEEYMDEVVLGTSGGPEPPPDPSVAAQTPPVSTDSPAEKAEPQSLCTFQDKPFRMLCPRCGAHAVCAAEEAFFCEHCDPTHDVPLTVSWSQDGILPAVKRLPPKPFRIVTDGVHYEIQRLVRRRFLWWRLGSWTWRTVRRPPYEDYWFGLVWLNARGTVRMRHGFPDRRPWFDSLADARRNLELLAAEHEREASRHDWREVPMEAKG